MHWSIYKKPKKEPSDLTSELVEDDIYYKYAPANVTWIIRRVRKIFLTAFYFLPLVILIRLKL